MKNVIGLFAVIFLLIGTLGFVVAEEDEVQIPEPKKVGFFENFGHKMSVAFTFNKERKIEKTLEMAEKRLAEAELLAEEDTEAYSLAQERYDELVVRAEKILNEIEAGNSTEDVGKIARIQNKFERHRERADEIYGRVLEKFELNNASAEKIERFEMFYERSLNRSNRMEIRIIEKRKAILERHQALGNLSEEELGSVLEDIEEREGLRSDRDDRETRSEVRIKRVLEIKNQYIDRDRLRLTDASLNSEERLEIKARILNADGNIERFEVRVRERYKNGEERFELRVRERTGSDNGEDESDDDESDDNRNSGGKEY